MRLMGFALIMSLTLGAAALTRAQAQSPDPAKKSSGPPPPQETVTLPSSTEVARFVAPEATQGVAVDRDHVYAVANSKVAKYDKKTGRKIAEWSGERRLFPHLNSCNVIERQLVCANSNFPQTPIWSAVEIFDPGSMRHLKTISLGPGVGSLTWVDRKDGSWWATFANYDGKGGELGRDHRHTTLVRFDDQWRRQEAWLFPLNVLERFAPLSSSGGVFGDDGLLYVTGHDRPEAYALQVPAGGGMLDYVATIPIQVEGQAIAWDRSQSRVLWGISRQNREVVAMRLPPVPTR